MKKFLSPILALILVACTTSQVTTTSEAIVTLPSPTATIIPTPTLTSQFVTLQEQIASSSERFALLPDGTIQEIFQENTKMVEGLSVNKEGEIMLLVDGEEITLEFADFTFDEIEGIKIKGFAYDEQSHKWSKIEFQVNTDYKKFLTCYVPPEAILDKSYVEYLKILDWPDFDPTKIVYRQLLRGDTYGQYDSIAYRGTTAPNYLNEDSRPYQRLVYCYTEFNETIYGVVPTRYYVEDMGAKEYPWIVGLIYLGPKGEGESPDADKQSWMDMYVQDMSFPVYIDTNFIFPPASTGLPPLPDPLPTELFARYPDIQARIDVLIAGDPTALDGVALPLNVANFGIYYK